MSSARFVYGVTIMLALLFIFGYKYHHRGDSAAKVFSYSVDPEVHRGYVLALQSSNPSVAICFTGQLRTFFTPLVQAGLEVHFHHLRYEYFLSVDVNPFAKKIRDGASEVILNSIRGRSYMNTKPYAVSYRPARCPPLSQMDTVLFPMAARYVACLNAIELEESRRGFSYDFVVRIRPDTMFYKPFPRIDVAFAKFGKGANVLVWDDQLGIAPRSHAGAIFLSPVMAYTTCGAGPEWVKACNGSVFNNFLPVPSTPAEWTTKEFHGQPPCEPMKRLISFQHASTTLHHCGFIDSGSCPQECTMDIIRPSLQSRVSKCSSEFYVNRSGATGFLSLLRSRSPHRRPIAEHRSFIGNMISTRVAPEPRVAICVHGPMNGNDAFSRFKAFLVLHNFKGYDFFVSSNFDSSRLLEMDDATRKNIRGFFHKNAEVMATSNCSSKAELQAALYAVACYNEVLVQETATRVTYDLIVSASTVALSIGPPRDVSSFIESYYLALRDKSAIVIVDDALVIGERISSGGIILLGPWEALQVCPEVNNFLWDKCISRFGLCATFDRVFSYFGDIACTHVKELWLVVTKTPAARNVSYCGTGRV